MAIPFNLDEDEIVVQHALKIERLLNELLTMLRWTPWTPVTGRLLTNHANNARDAARLQQQRPAPNSQQPRGVRVARPPTVRPREDHHRAHPPRRPATDAVVAAVAARVRAQNMPDLVPPNVVQAFRDQKPARTVMLQVELCPECYYNPEGRTLKVVGATRVEKSNVGGEVILREDDGALLRSLHSMPDAADLSPDHHARECPPSMFTESRGSKIKKRLASLINPSKIETPLLTAAFVVIGWKMFIKQ